MDFYLRVLQELWRNFASSTAEQVLGALLTIAIIVTQIKLGIIRPGQIRDNFLSIAWPYGLLIVGLLFWNAIRAPVLVYHAQLDSINDLTKRVAELEQKLDMSKPKFTFQITQGSIKTDIAGLKGLVLFADLINRGADSALINWKAFYKTGSSQERLQIIHPVNELTFPWKEYPDRVAVVKPDQDLMVMTRKIVPRSVPLNGIIIVSVSDAQLLALNNKEASILVSTEDYLGQEYTAKYAMGGTGELGYFPGVDIEKNSIPSAKP